MQGTPLMSSQCSISICGIRRLIQRAHHLVNLFHDDGGSKDRKLLLVVLICPRLPDSRNVSLRQQGSIFYRIISSPHSPLTPLPQALNSSVFTFFPSTLRVEDCLSFSQPCCTSVRGPDIWLLFYIVTLQIPSHMLFEFST